LYSNCLKWKYRADCCRKDALCFTSIYRRTWLRKIVCFSKYASRMCNYSKQRFLHIVTNASPKLQIAVPLTLSAQSINSSDFIPSFLLFYLICRFLTYIPILISSLLHATRFLILLFTEFPHASFSALCYFHRVYYSPLSSFFFLSFFLYLSFFLSSLFLRISLPSFFCLYFIYIFSTVIITICPLFPSLCVLCP
jgi:hypothetical protein